MKQIPKQKCHSFGQKTRQLSQEGTELCPELTWNVIDLEKVIFSRLGPHPQGH